MILLVSRIFCFGSCRITADASGANAALGTKLRSEIRFAFSCAFRNVRRGSQGDGSYVSPSVRPSVASTSMFPQVQAFPLHQQAWIKHPTSID